MKVVTSIEKDGAETEFVRTAFSAAHAWNDIESALQRHGEAIIKECRKRVTHGRTLADSIIQPATESTEDRIWYVVQQYCNEAGIKIGGQLYENDIAPLLAYLQENLYISSTPTKITEYDIVSRDSVPRMLESGWKLHGHPFIGENGGVVQAMVR